MNEAESLLTQDAEEESPWRRLLPYGTALLVAAVVGFALYRLLSNDSTARKTVSDVVTVKLVQTPPPPPPPEPEEPVEEQIEPEPEPLDQPRPAETPPSLAAPSAMPGPAGPPGVAGLPSGGAPGGIAGGGGGGGGGDPFGYYAALLQSRVQSAVQKQPSLRRTRYRVDVQVWVTADGAPQRVELINSLGSAELDKQFRETLLRMAKLPQAPPQNMPQPVVLQVNSL